MTSTTLATLYWMKHDIKIQKLFYEWKQNTHNSYNKLTCRKTLRFLKHQQHTENELPKEYCGQTLEVNEDVPDQNQDGLAGWRKMQGKLVEEISGRKPRIQVAIDICLRRPRPNQGCTAIPVLAQKVVSWTLDFRESKCFWEDPKYWGEPFTGHEQVNLGTNLMILFIFVVLLLCTN